MWNMRKEFHVKQFTSKTQKIGEIGEEQACMFLMKHGFTILERNISNKFGEIDIVSRYKGVLHIVEVKTSQNSSIRPEENMNAKKMRKVAKLAEFYAKGELFCIDFVGIYLSDDNSLKKVVYLHSLEIN
jgi:putative endonuclease